jgi:hypothetical protein
MNMSGTLTLYSPSAFAKRTCHRQTVGASTIVAAKLDASVGRQNDATSSSASALFVASTSASTASRAQEIFLRKGLDSRTPKLPVGKITGGNRTPRWVEFAKVRPEAHYGLRSCIVQCPFCVPNSEVAMTRPLS